MREEVDFTTTDATALLGSVPSDFKEYRGKPYITAFLGGVRVLSTTSSRVKAEKSWPRDGEGAPQMLLETNSSDDDGTSTWEVYPLPDAQSDYSDGEYRVTVPYWRFLSDLSGDSDTNWFTLNAEEWIEYYATAQGFALDWDEGRQAAWEAKAAGEYRDVLMADKKRILSEGPGVLVPHTGTRDYQDLS